MKKTTPTLVMEESLWFDLKDYATRHRTTASEIIGRLVAGYLKKAKKKGGD
ncbi:MAG: hypothetical protein O7B35_12555 [Deltaproteobacteria bacterium]|nr:hypothetical protein [Deltaproteobacteria bacterium]